MPSPSPSLKSHNGALLIAVAAPSGAGKSSLVARLLATVPDLYLSISTTTRPQRQGEIEGKNYFFTTPEDFARRAQSGEFVEHALVHGNHYGTSKHWLEAQLAQQHDILLELDWQGVAQLKKLFPTLVSVFILPPDLATLRQRLEARRQDSESVIEQRMQVASTEIMQATSFNYAIVNREFATSVEALQAIVKAERCRFAYQRHHHPDLFSSFAI